MMARILTQSDDGLDDAVQRIVEQIVDEADPLRIILFGSRATGAARPDSDVDLLVVMPDSTSCRATMQRLYRRVRRTEVGADMLVATPSILDRHAESVGLIYREILETGREVYVAS